MGWRKDREHSKADKDSHSVHLNPTSDFHRRQREQAPERPHSKEGGGQGKG